MSFNPGDRVRWATRDVEGTVLDDHAAEYPDFIAIQWDNGDRTFSAPTHIKIQAVESRDALSKVTVTAQKPAAIKEQIPMYKTIKTPETMQDFARLASLLDLGMAETLDFLTEVIGDNWWNSDQEDFTLVGVPDARPNITRTIPAGFTPLDAECDVHVGKRMDGARWTVLSEWSIRDGFTLSFWTADDDPMTAAETSEYAGALVEMTAYITGMGNAWREDDK